MAIIITLDDIRIKSWEVDTSSRNVTVRYEMLDSNDEVHSTGVAVFWETMPSGSDPIWYQLPASYSSLLTDLTSDVRNALLPIVNE